MHPSISPVPLLNGVHSPLLELFATNLPNRVLPVFLMTHSHINALIFHACGRGVTCPSMVCVSLA